MDTYTHSMIIYPSSRKTEARRSCRPILGGARRVIVSGLLIITITNAITYYLLLITNAITYYLLLLLMLLLITYYYYLLLMLLLITYYCY